MTGFALAADNRGRVRFAHDGMRYEVTKTGKVNCYERDQTFGEQPLPMYNHTDYASPAFLRTLADAIELAVLGFQPQPAGL